MRAVVQWLACWTANREFKFPPGQKFGSRFLLHVRPLSSSANNNNLRVSDIRLSNRTLIYNVCPKSALT